MAFQNDRFIKRLFTSPKTSKQGFYGVWLCHDGEWRQVVVDDYFPINEKGKPMFCKPNGNELWVLLLEK